MLISSTDEGSEYLQDGRKERRWGVKRVFHIVSFMRVMAYRILVINHTHTQKSKRNGTQELVIMFYTTWLGLCSQTQENQSTRRGKSEYNSLTHYRWSYTLLKWYQRSKTLSLNFHPNQPPIGLLMWHVFTKILTPSPLTISSHSHKINRWSPT